MEIYYGVIVFIVGLLIGSFLNVCIYRIPRHESIAFGASHCTNCGKRIKWYDLIPVISFIILGGKCRNFKEKISIQYPLIEALNAIIYLCIYVFFKLSVITFLLCTISSILIVMLMIKLLKKG